MKNSEYCSLRDEAVVIRNPIIRCKSHPVLRAVGTKAIDVADLLTVSALKNILPVGGDAAKIEWAWQLLRTHFPGMLENLYIYRTGKHLPFRPGMYIEVPHNVSWIYVGATGNLRLRRSTSNSTFFVYHEIKDVLNEDEEELGEVKDDFNEGGEDLDGCEGDFEKGSMEEEKKKDIITELFGLEAETIFYLSPILGARLKNKNHRKSLVGGLEILRKKNFLNPSVFPDQHQGFDE